MSTKKIQSKAIEKVLEYIDSEPAELSKAYNLLLLIYESINPDWRKVYEEYRQGDKRQEEYIRKITKRLTPKAPQDIKELWIEEGQPEDEQQQVINLEKIIQLSNRTSHGYKACAQELLKRSNCGIDWITAQKIFFPLSESQKKRILGQLNQEEVERFETSENGKLIGKLIKGYRGLKEIEDATITILLDKFKQMENPQKKYSYGYRVDDRENRYNRDTLVMDVPGHGQFAVHIRQDQHKEGLPVYPYPLYEKSNVILIGGLTEDAKEFLGLDDPETTNREDVMGILTECELADANTHRLAVQLMDNRYVDITPEDLATVEQEIVQHRKEDGREQQ